MEETGHWAPRKRRPNAYGRTMRRGRIFARTREGWAYDEIARKERLTAERIRQIVSEVLQKRKVRHRRRSRQASTGAARAGDALRK